MAIGMWCLSKKMKRPNYKKLGIWAGKESVQDSFGSMKYERYAVDL